MDPYRVREDFPILARQINGRRLVYLDSAATSQKPESVLAAMDGFYRRHNANVHRGVYTLAAEATAMYEGARARVARFLGAAEPAEVVFTRGTTEAINLVAHSWGEAHLEPGDAVLLTEMEHHANLVPWQLLAQRRGIELRFLRLTDSGTLDLTALPTLLDEKVKLVSFVHVSNALGTVNPVAELVSAARAVGAKVLLDAAQSAPHMPLHLAELGVDFLAFSSHKVCGPMGIGVLWARREILEAMPPFLGGGEMIRHVTLEGSTYAASPARFEAGTPPVAEAVGLSAALDYLDALGLEEIHAHVSQLSAAACTELDKVPGLQRYGPNTQRGPAIAFTLDGVHPHDLATILDTQGVAVRAGHHCTQPLHRRYGLSATARASFYLYNTHEDLEALLAALKEARRVFGLTLAG